MPRPVPCLSSQQEAPPPGLPILFDSRERLPKPDLSSLVRLRFLTSVDFPPFNFADQNGKLAGFHVDLAREICDELGISDKCQIQALPFDELQGALAASQGDAVIAGVAVTPELRKNFAFSRPFLMLPARFVRNLKASIDGGTAAALAGHPVGVVKGTAHEAMLAAFFPAVKQVPFDDKDALLAAVKDGKVDAAFADGLATVLLGILAISRKMLRAVRRTLSFAAISRRGHDHHVAPAERRSDGRDQSCAGDIVTRRPATGNLSAVFLVRALLIKFSAAAVASNGAALDGGAGELVETETIAQQAEQAQLLGLDREIGGGDLDGKRIGGVS